MNFLDNPIDRFHPKEGDKATKDNLRVKKNRINRIQRDRRFQVTDGLIIEDFN